MLRRWWRVAVDVEVWVRVRMRVRLREVGWVGRQPDGIGVVERALVTKLVRQQANMRFESQ